jgi:hypothetical protein
MVALIVLLLLLAVLGGLGFAAHFLWFLGFFIGGAEAGLGGGRRRWYGRW